MCEITNPMSELNGRNVEPTGREPQEGFIASAQDGS
jgi:hypothetical protein